jgi:hypothetical protein
MVNSRIKNNVLYISDSVNWDISTVRGIYKPVQLKQGSKAKEKKKEK